MHLQNIIVLLQVDALQQRRYGSAQVCDTPVAVAGTVAFLQPTCYYHSHAINHSQPLLTRVNGSGVIAIIGSGKFVVVLRFVGFCVI